LGLRIDPGQIRSFVQIAAVAGEAEIIVSIRSAMLSRGDVLDMKAEVESALRQATILAARLRTADNMSASRGVQPFASRSVDLPSQRLDDAEHVCFLNQILVLQSLVLGQRSHDCLCGECIDTGLNTRGDLNRQNPRRDFGRQAF